MHVTRAGKANESKAKRELLNVVSNGGRQAVKLEEGGATNAFVYNSG